MLIHQAVSPQVHGIDVDFVNLRTETYADSSRIPEAATGTPQQARQGYLVRQSHSCEP